MADMSAYSRLDPAQIMGEAKATALFGAREFCRWCERVHRSGWFFADCLDLQGDAAAVRALETVIKQADKLP